MVFTTPAVAALRRRFPDAHISYLVEPAAAPVVAGNPHIDRVIVAPRQRGVSGALADVRLGLQFRREKYDLVIDFHGGPRASLLTWLTGAPERVGYEIVGRGWMYTRRVGRPRVLRPRHSVENQWDLIADLGAGPPDRDRWPVEMPPDPEAVATVADRLARAGVGAGDRVIVVHVSAGNPFRRWPIDSFVELVSGLASADSNWRIVVTSGPSEQAAAARVIADARARLMADAQGRVLACGEFSLAELRALVDRAALYIGGDSGPLHIAATTRAPIVGLYGPTLPARSAPWRSSALVAVAVDAGDLPCRPCDQRRCEPGDFRCLTSITPQQVLDAAIKCLR